MPSSCNTELTTVSSHVLSVWSQDICGIFASTLTQSNTQAATDETQPTQYTYLPH